MSDSTKTTPNVNDADAPNVDETIVADGENAFAPGSVEWIEDQLIKKGATNVRPEAVAEKLGISGKVVRAYLRQTFPRPLDVKGTTWVLNANETARTLHHFRNRTNAANGVSVLPDDV